MRTNRLPAFCCLLFLPACQASGTLGTLESGPRYTTEGPASIPGAGDSALPTDTADPVDTDAPPIEVDCSALPSEPTEKVEVEGARGYHGLVFDDDGYMLGWDGRSGLVGARSDGTSELRVPGIDSAEQLVRFDDGRIFVLNQWEEGVDLITPEGGRTSFVRGLNGFWPYGLVLGPDGMLYVVDGNIYRLDPDTADMTLLYSGTSEWMMPHTVGFSLDSRTMYIAMVGEGWMYSVELDEELNFVGEPAPFAYMDGGWQDTAVVDVCGNIYVSDYYTSRVYRVTPEGEASLFMQARSSGYPHALAWGTGEDGWDALSFYAPLPYAGNSVVRYAVGVPDGKYVREWNGVRVGR